MATSDIPTVEAMTLSAPTPVELLRIAVSQNADIDKLTKLMDLQERWERNEARKAFSAAMKDFKANPPTITKNKHVKITPKDSSKFGAEYDHATLDEVCNAVTKGLSEHGISHRWKIDQADQQWIKVTCILTHEMGHSEETTLLGAPDNTGSKNSIQAVGSTVTYLQRYTLLAATGLAASNSDTDGRLPTAAAIPQDRVAEQVEWIKNACSLDELKKLFRNAYVEAETAKDRKAMAQYIKAKDARKAELS